MDCADPTAAGNLTPTGVLGIAACVSLDDIRRAFLLMDANADGRLQVPEVLDALRRAWGPRFSVREAEELVAGADLNKDGEIDFHEFLAALKKELASIPPLASLSLSPSDSSSSPNTPLSTATLTSTSTPGASPPLLSPSTSFSLSEPRTRSPSSTSTEPSWTFQAPTCDEPAGETHSAGAAAVAAMSLLRQQLLEPAFSVFDRDSDGLISAHDLRDALHALTGETASLDECALMIRRVDQNSDGVLDLSEFCSMMMTQ